MGRGLLAALAAGFLAMVALRRSAAPAALRQSMAPVQLDALPSDQALVEGLQKAVKQVEALQARVDSGRLVANFGDKSRAIVADAAAVSPQLEEVVDGYLQALFIRQLGLLRKQQLDSVERDQRTSTAVERARKAFELKAQRLVRPGSDWSFEEETTDLTAQLQEAVDMKMALDKERSRAAQTQRATADVVGRMQKEMDTLGSKLRGVGAGSPWTLWTSYRLPGTPYQMSARYQEGRANIELNLSPASDPTKAQAGFVEGLTSQNLGLSLNIGV